MLNFEHLLNIHKDETAIVIGNGLSLLNVPLEFLKSYPSFGSNKIYLLPNFTPTYYTCINATVIKQNKKEIKQLKCTKFIKRGLGFRKDYELSSLNVAMGCIFSYAPQVCVWEGFTVTYVILQLAFFIGFKTVLLVGCDHRYKFDGLPNVQVYMAGDDPNHFSSEYFKGQTWDTPNFVPVEEAYQMAREAYELYDRRIINLTENSALDIFEKGNIKDWS